MYIYVNGIKICNRRMQCQVQRQVKVPTSFDTTGGTGSLSIILNNSVG